MTAVLFVAAVVALVWIAVVFLRGGLVGGCLVVLLAGCCFGHPFYNLPVGPIPLTADRLLWAALLIQYVIWCRLGLADPKRPGRAEFVLGAFFVVLILNTFAHDWRAHDAMPVARLVFYYLMPLGIYWVARQSALSERAVVATFYCLAALGVYLAVTALAEIHQAWWLVYPKYIASTTHAEFFGRGRGPLLNPMACGMLQGICLCATLILWPRLNRAGKLLLLALALVICLGIYSTLTRSAWLGAGAGLLILLGLVLPRTWRAPALVGSLLVAATVGITQWEHLLTFKRDEALSARETAESVKLRPILARVAWNMFLDRPLVGCGFGHYEDQSVYYLADRSTELPLEKARPYGQHNVFLALLAETGVLGLGLFVILLGLWVRDAWAIWRSGASPSWARQQAVLFLVLMGNYLAGAMFHDVTIIPMVNMLVFFIAGVTAGLRPVVERARANECTEGTNGPSTSELSLARLSADGTSAHTDAGCRRRTVGG